MYKIKEAIIVEGNYDKIKLGQIFDAYIISVNGFSIFKDDKKMKMITDIAKKDGIIILTDSDRAGFKIRNHFNKCIEKKYLKHAYIPEIQGKEKRKQKSSKDGFLGVEGVKDEYLIDAVIKSGCTILNSDINIKKVEGNITKLTLFEDGLTGNKNSSIYREKLLTHLNLPKKMSTNALVSYLNIQFSLDEYKAIVCEILNK